MFEYQEKKSDSKVVQRLMGKLGKDKTQYQQYLRSRVVLYAELDGKPVGTNGLFESSSRGHAEENLLSFLSGQGIETGHLKIYLSTSPCSSVFGTRKDEKEGCIEKLEKSKFNLEIKNDHHYIPAHLRGVEKDAGFWPGFSSESALSESGITSSIEPGIVAQFYNSKRNIL